MRETMYLMRSPETARRLTGAIARLNAGRGVEHALIEPEDGGES
jgi:antitoxin YefM